jgi:hypothetical protein
MNTLELASRLENILQGPWAEEAKPFLEYISGKGNVKKPSEEALKKLLRPHWKKEISGNEAYLRNAFDEALSELQLIELAVQTGYLPFTPEVKTETLGKLKYLLSSDAAQQYIGLYDFIGVRFIGSRAGFLLHLRDVVPPSINAKAQVRFSAFLSQHRSWYESENLDLFLGLMDDYIYEDDDDKYDFARYLETGKIPKDEDRAQLFEDLKSGMFEFIYKLSDLFSILERDEIPYFGIFYSYWLAKFFGYDLGDKGYEESDDYEWAELAKATTPPHAERATGEKEDEKIMRDTIKRIKTIQNSWNLTSRFVAKHVRNGK